MANASPLASNSSAQPPLPTPSPFSYSVASATWSSRSPIEVSNLVLRSLALLLSFASALTLAAPSSKKNTRREDSSFQDYKALMYCFIVDISVFLYTAYQLFKGICDIAYRGIFISEMISDYINFIFDQMAGFLLISSSSVTVLTIQQMDSNKSLWKEAVISVSMSFATFVVIVICALLSGYKLFKRIVW